MKKKMRKLMEGLASSIEAQYPFLSENEQKNLLEDFIYNSLINTYLSEGPKLDALKAKIERQNDIMLNGKLKGKDKATVYAADDYLSRVDDAGKHTHDRLLNKLKAKKDNAIYNGSFYKDLRDVEKLPVKDLWRATTQGDLDREYQRKLARINRHRSTLGLPDLRSAAYMFKDRRK